MAGGYPYDPAMANAALEQMGYGYRVPMSQPEPLMSVDPGMSMPAPMAPETAPMGPPAPGPVADLVRVGNLGARPWPGQPAPQAQLPAAAPQAPAGPPPAIRFASATTAQPSPSMPALPPATSLPRGAGVASPRSPYAAMAAKAGAQASTEQQLTDQAEQGGDFAAATMQEAVQQQGEAQATTQDVVAKLQTKAAQQERDSAAMLAKEQAIHNDAMARRLQDIDRDNQVMESYGTPKDNRTGAQKAMGLIAVALSGVGNAFSAMAGQQAQNAGLAMVNADIERRLTEQRERLANARTAVGAKQTAMGIAQSLYTDKVDQLHMARALELSAVEKELNAARSQGLSKEAMARADELAAGLAMQRNDLLLNLHDGRAQRYVQQQTSATLAKYQEDKARQAAAAAANSPERMLKLQGQAADVEKTRAEAAKLRGEAGGTDAKSLADIGKQIGVLNSVRKDVAQVSSILNDEKYKNDLPGFGAFDSRRPDWANSRENIDTRNAVDRIMGAMLRGDSGAAIGDEEKATFFKSRGIDWTGNEGDQRRALQYLVQEYGDRLGGIYAQNPQAAQQYEQNLRQFSPGARAQDQADVVGLTRPGAAK